MPNENTIFFYPGRAGHSHNGTNSSFIDTSAYSLFDFAWSTSMGTPDRRITQGRNYTSFQNYIINIVNSAILEPAGIVLQEKLINASHIISGSITGDEIAANTITADNLLANFVLVDNIIASGNWDGEYDPTSKGISNVGTVGWAITSNGDAVFGTQVLRGALIADSVYINDFNQWTSAGDFIVGSNTTGNGIFFDSATGNFDITGHVYALGGQIAGWLVDGNNLLAGGGFDGEMVIGPGYGPPTGLSNTASGAMFVSASFNASYTSEVNYNGYLTTWALRNRTTNSIDAQLDIDAQGVSYQYGNERFEFRVFDGNAYIVIDGTQYPLTIGSGSAAGGSGGTGTGGGGGECSTCIIGAQEARATIADGASADCGGGGCFEIWELRECAPGCTCDGTCVDTKIEDCTGPGCGAPAPSFFSPPTFFGPPSFFAPPSFK
jgi:hypothetical protein